MKKEVLYESPESRVTILNSEGVICGSESDYYGSFGGEITIDDESFKEW